MRKFGSLLILGGFLFLVGCAQNNASVIGNIINSDGETVVLEKLTSTEAQPVDSMTIKDDGSFKLKTADLTEPGFYRLSVNKNNFVILLLDKGEKAEVTGNALDFYKSYEISGSEGSVKLRLLDQTLRADFEKVDSLRKTFQAFQQAGHPRLDSISLVIDAQFQESQKKKRDFVVGFINENSNSLVALSAVQALNPDTDMETFEKVAKDLMAVYPESDYVKKFNMQLIDLRTQKQAAERTNIGSPAPEIAVTTPEGTPIKLSDFKGKVTLIDFWASWCKPCRMENPNVVKVYNRFKNKGFEIFGVSLDQDGGQWKAAIAQDGLTWKHGSELKFWQSSFVPTYNLDGIPMAYLVDAEGIIIAKGLRGEQLEQKLEEILGK